MTLEDLKDEFMEIGQDYHMLKKLPDDKILEEVKGGFYCDVTVDSYVYGTDILFKINDIVGGINETEVEYVEYWTNSKHLGDAVFIMED